jgi:hypothetical protein
MQFKKQGNRVQVLAYRGYDKVKRRAIVKMLGSYDVHSYEMTDGLLDSLTVDEKEELQSRIEKERQSDQKAIRQYNLKYIDSRIKEVADSISGGEFEINQEWATSVHDAIDALTKVMRANGYTKQRKKVVKAVDNQSLSLPLAD